jgi:membrane protein DedA with SNARE-associated domain
MYGLILLFALVAVESCGVPLPGETTLITASVLAASGRFNIVEVIAIAAAGAIVGDSTGYWIARVGGRPALEKIPFVRDAVPKLLPRGEVFFEKHGPKTVLFARFVAGLRITIAWLAGLSRMHWGTFLLYNAAGGILWATAIGLASYYFGKKVVDAITNYGLYAVVVIVALGVLAFFGYRWWRKRSQKRAAATTVKSDIESKPAE